MPTVLRLGRLPAQSDLRIPALDALSSAQSLPTPPASVDFYSKVADWGMLGNAEYGDCVEACIGHTTLALTTYAGKPAQPSASEALALYSDITGFVASEPSTDNGTVILGAGGAMEYWATSGARFGGELSYAKAYAQVKLGSDALWFRQSIHYFGNTIIGINLPESIMTGSEPPALWADYNGPIAGGHCVLLAGYGVVNGVLCFDLISWGKVYKMTLPFLRHTLEEAVVVYDPDSLNARGVDAAGFDPSELMAAMAVVKAAA